MSKNAEKKKFLTLRSRWSNDRRKTSVLFFFNGIMDELYLL